MLKDNINCVSQMFKLETDKANRSIDSPGSFLTTDLLISPSKSGGLMKTE